MVNAPHQGIPVPRSQFPAPCQACLCVGLFLDVDRCGEGKDRFYLLHCKCKYMLSTFCVDNSVDELFLTAPGSLITCAHIRLIKNWPFMYIYILHVVKKVTQKRSSMKAYSYQGNKSALNGMCVKVLLQLGTVIEKQLRVLTAITLRGGLIYKNAAGGTRRWPRLGSSYLETSLLIFQRKP